MNDRELAEAIARVIVADIRAEQLERRESGQVAKIDIVAIAPTRSGEQSSPEVVEDRFA